MWIPRLLLFREFFVEVYIIVGNILFVLFPWPMTYENVLSLRKGLAVVRYENLLVTSSVKIDVQILSGEYYSR